MDVRGCRGALTEREGGFKLSIVACHMFGKVIHHLVKDSPVTAGPRMPDGRGRHIAIVELLLSL
jgi:hypothetical protein